MDIDLLDELVTDIFLIVKKDNINNPSRTVFVKYIVPRIRKNGSVRTYADLYNYFTDTERQETKGFRFARAYILQSSWCGKFWENGKQIFYFSKSQINYEVYTPKEKFFLKKQKKIN